MILVVHQRVRSHQVIYCPMKPCNVLTGISCDIKIKTNGWGNVQKEMHSATWKKPKLVLKHTWLSCKRTNDIPFAVIRAFFQFQVYSSTSLTHIKHLNLIFRVLHIVCLCFAPLARSAPAQDDNWSVFAENYVSGPYFTVSKLSLHDVSSSVLLPHFLHTILAMYLLFLPNGGDNAQIYPMRDGVLPVWFSFKFFDFPSMVTMANTLAIVERDIWHTFWTQTTQFRVLWWWIR